MSIFVGTILGTADGETVRVVRGTFLDDNGNPLTDTIGKGLTPKLEVRVRGTDTLVATVVGSWTDSNQQSAVFPVGLTPALVPASGTVLYDGIYRIDSGPNVVSRFGADGNAAPVGFGVQAWP